MLREEALWLKAVLGRLAPERGAVLLDIGSSNEYFRRVMQPYVDYYVFRPLRRQGLKIVHIDSRPDEGVDVVCDVASVDSQPEVDAIPRGDYVLCSSLLEHVTDRDRVVQRLIELTKPGGVLIVTVPHVYRYHPDPIDTMFRPDNATLETIFSRSEIDIVQSTIVQGDCGYETVPGTLTARLALRLRNGVKYGLLRREFVPERCSVAAVVMRRQTV